MATYKEIDILEGIVRHSDGLAYFQRLVEKALDTVIQLSGERHVTLGVSTTHSARAFQTRQATRVQTAVVQSRHS